MLSLIVSTKSIRLSVAGLSVNLAWGADTERRDDGTVRIRSDVRRPSPLDNFAHYVDR